LSFSSEGRKTVGKQRIGWNRFRQNAGRKRPLDIRIASNLDQILSIKTLLTLLVFAQFYNLTIVAIASGCFKLAT